MIKADEIDKLEQTTIEKNNQFDELNEKNDQLNDKLISLQKSWLMNLIRLSHYKNKFN